MQKIRKPSGSIDGKNLPLLVKVRRNESMAVAEPRYAKLIPISGVLQAPRRRNLVFNCLFALAALASGCKTKSIVPSAPELPAVVTVVAIPTPAPPIVRRGTVASGARYRLGFNVPGVVATLCCRTGDRVKSGQLLATLRSADVDARVKAADAAQSKAERDLLTAQQLVQNGALAPNLDKDARDQWAVSAAQAQAAKAAFGFTRLQSPIAGTVQQRLAEPGEAVGPGVPVLLVEEVGRLVVRVGVNEEDRASIARGTGVELSVDGKEGAVPGKVSQVAPVPEASDGLFSIEVTPDASSVASLVPGALVSVAFKSAGTASVFLIPLDALVERNQKKGVFVVDAAAGQAKAVFRELKIQRVLGKDVSVVGGLVTGEVVIAEGSYFLEDGERVRPLAPATTPHG